MLDYDVFDGTAPLGTIGRSGFPDKNWTFLLPGLMGSWQIPGQEVKT